MTAIFMQKERQNNIFSAPYWREAARQLKDVRMITVAALIVALRIAVKFLKIQIAPGLNISLIAEQSVGVLHRDGADSRFRRKTALGGQLGIVGEITPNNVVPDQAVQLQIHRPLRFIDHVLHLMI